MSSKNTILSDPIPTWAMPEVKDKKVTKPTPDDWEKLGKSRKYKEINKWIESRKEYWRHFLPDGTAIKDLPDDQVAAWWKCASTIIDEYENLQLKIETTARK